MSTIAIVVACGACGSASGDDDETTTSPTTASSNSNTDPTSSTMPGSESSSSGGGEPIACADVTTREACEDTTAQDTEGFGSACRWIDLYRYEVVDAACQFTPVDGGGLCVGDPGGDTDCGSDDACDIGTVYFRMAGDGSTEVLRSGDTCSSGRPAGEWMDCAAPASGESTGGSSGGSTGGGDTTSSSSGADEPDLCTCACDELTP
ncbi:MAG: hypothetical protein IPK74_10430 [Deltaproteobacteria bacterium]|nr:hypothetical protein [Deltaproteobacteria bacterium]